MSTSNGKTSFIYSAIVISAFISTLAPADEVYNKAGQYKYTAPKWGDIRSIRVTLIGGGGGGAGGGSNTGNFVETYVSNLGINGISGGGGGSGATTVCNFYPPSKDLNVQAITINVGAGGKGGMGGATDDSGGHKGGDGGSSSITTVNTNVAAYTPVYGSQSGVIAAGGSGATGAFERSSVTDNGAGGAGGGLSVECRKPDAVPESATPGRAGESGKRDVPGAGASGSSLEACKGAGAGGKGGLNGSVAAASTPGLPGESGSDGCVILELVKF